MSTVYCSTYFVLAVVSMPTACNSPPCGYPALTLFHLVVRSLKSLRERNAQKLRQPQVRDVWMCLYLLSCLLLDH